MSEVVIPVQRSLERVIERPSQLGGGVFKLTAQWGGPLPPSSPLEYQSASTILKPYYYTVLCTHMDKPQPPSSDDEPTLITLDTKPTFVCLKTSNPGGSWMMKDGSAEGGHKNLYGFCVHGHFEARTCKTCARNRLVTLVEAHKKGVISKDSLQGGLDEERAQTLYRNAISQCVCKGHVCKACFWESIQDIMDTPLDNKEFWDKVDEVKILDKVKLVYAGTNGCEHKKNKGFHCDHGVRWSGCKDPECSKKEFGTGSMFCSGCGKNKGRGPCCVFGTQLLMVEEMHRYVQRIPLDMQMELLDKDNYEGMCMFIDAYLKEVVMFKKPWIWSGKGVCMTFMRKEFWGEWMTRYLMDMRDPVKHALANKPLPRQRVRSKDCNVETAKKGGKFSQPLTEYLAQVEPLILATPLVQLDTSKVNPPSSHAEGERAFKPVPRRVIPKILSAPVVEEIDVGEGGDGAGSSSSPSVTSLIKTSIKGMSNQALTLTRKSLKGLLEKSWEEPTPVYFRGLGKRRFVLMEVSEEEAAAAGKKPCKK